MSTFAAVHNNFLFLYQNLPKGAVWTLGMVYRHPLSSIQAPLGRSRYIWYIHVILSFQRVPVQRKKPHKDRVSMKMKGTTSTGYIAGFLTHQQPWLKLQHPRRRPSLCHCAGGIHWFQASLGGDKSVNYWVVVSVFLKIGEIILFDEHTFQRGWCKTTN